MDSQVTEVENQSQTQLLAEIRELRAQLKEAEELRPRAVSQSLNHISFKSIFFLE